MGELIDTLLGPLRSKWFDQSTPTTQTVPRQLALLMLQALTNLSGICEAAEDKKAASKDRFREMQEVAKKRKTAVA